MPAYYNLGMNSSSSATARGLLLAIETSSRRGSVALVQARSAPTAGTEPGRYGETAGTEPGRYGETAGTEPGRYGEMAGTTLDVRVLSADRRHTAELLPTVAAMLADHAASMQDVAVYAYSCGPGSFTGLRVAATIGRMLRSAAGCEVVAVPSLEVIACNALAHSGAADRIVTILDAKRGQVYGAAFERRSSNSAGTPVFTKTPSEKTPPSKSVSHSESSSRTAAGEAASQPVDPGSGSQAVDPGIDSRPAGPGGDLPAELRTLIPAALFDPAELFARVPPPFVIIGEGIAKHRAACEQTGQLTLPEELWLPHVEHVAAIGARLAQAGTFCRPEEIVPHYIRRPECEEVYEERRAAAKAKRNE